MDAVADYSAVKCTKYDARKRWAEYRVGRMTFVVEDSTVTVFGNDSTAMPVMMDFRTYSSFPAADQAAQRAARRNVK